MGAKRRRALTHNHPSHRANLPAPSQRRRIRGAEEKNSSLNDLPALNHAGLY